MKSIGIVRKIDELGRICIPKGLRMVLDIKSWKEKDTLDIRKIYSDSVEMFVNGEEIILRKYNPGCHCCGSIKNLKEILGLKICNNCLNEFIKAKEIIDKED